MVIFGEDVETPGESFAEVPKLQEQTAVATAGREAERPRETSPTIPSPPEQSGVAISGRDVKEPQDEYQIVMRSQKEVSPVEWSEAMTVLRAILTLSAHTRAEDTNPEAENCSKESTPTEAADQTPTRSPG